MLRLIEDEDRTIRRYQRRYWILSLLGGIAIGLGIVPVARAGSDMFWLFVLAALGGLMCGWGALYWSSCKQWPLLRPYLNVKAIRDDKNEESA